MSEIVYGEEPRDAYQELVEDLLAIATSFAGKLYGMRSHRKRRLVQGFKQLLEEVERGLVNVSLHFMPSLASIFFIISIVSL